MASKFQQHQGFGVDAIQWRSQPDQQSSERTYNRTEVLDLANQDVTESYEFVASPVNEAEEIISAEMAELMADDAEIRQMRQEMLEGAA